MVYFGVIRPAKAKHRRAPWYLWLKGVRRRTVRALIQVSPMAGKGPPHGGAGWTSKIGDFRPAQNPCIKNPSVLCLLTRGGRWARPTSIAPGARGGVHTGTPSCPTRTEHRSSCLAECGKSLKTGPPHGGAGSLSFCWFSRLLLVFLGPPAGFPALPALF
jgi:hypothetical protein